jgi:hypothetical protein
MSRARGSLRARHDRVTPAYLRWALPCALAFAGCDGSVGFDDQRGVDELESGSVEPAAKITTVDPVITDRLAAGDAAEVLVLVDDRAQQAARANQLALLGDFTQDEALSRGLDATKDRILGRIGSQHLAALTSYRRLPFLHVRIDSPEALAALVADPDVMAVAPDASYNLLETAPANLALINQPKAAAAGSVGAGTSVAVLDTGADFKRAPFSCSKAGGDCKVAFAADFAPDDNRADDPVLHGTNVSAIILAVAPAAKILALDVFTGASASTSNILSAINWAIDNRTKYNIAAMNMSFGGGAFTSPCGTDVMAVAIDRARAVGILSAVASGNEARTNSLSSPACGPSAVSVGAVYAANVGALKGACTDATSAADKVPCFSNSASFLTVLAPGVAISAAGITMTGTSQATPHVAGALAVLHAAFPAEAPTALVTRLTSTGVQVKDARNDLTKPRLDLAAALSGAAAPLPAPKPAPTGTVVLAAGAKYTKTTSISAAVPTTSGVATQVCLSATATCTTWVKWAASVAFTLPAVDGLQTVRVWWKDAAGSITAEPKTATITLDRAAPTGGKVTVTLVGNVANFVWTGVTDATSGVASTKLVGSTTGSPAANCTGGTVLSNGLGFVASQTVTKGKPYYYRLCATDNAGLTSAGIAGQFTVPR